MLNALPTAPTPGPSNTTIHLKAVGPNAAFLRIMGVNYIHMKTADEGDLYVTEHGLPFVRHLQPANWYEEPWFTEKRQRLEGTGTVYRVPTKPIENGHLKSIDMVVKWSRVGQDVPISTFMLDMHINAEFNTPFEEFSLVEELRRGEFGPGDLRILCQKPLAIYVPPERMQQWQTGRSRDKLQAKFLRHPGVEIDVLRSYILLYQWIDGPDAVTAYGRCCLDARHQKEELRNLTTAVDADLAAKGFTVADHKPTHLILRMDGPQVRKRPRGPRGKVAYAIVDYELLARTAEHEETIKRAARSEYLYRQRDRLLARPGKDFPAHLRPAQLMGVPYVYGRTESTGGALWVVGHDPDLFAYFLPERWRKKQFGLSASGQAYFVTTKDRIYFVWKVSRVGDVPPGDMGESDYAQKVLAYGYNSPFEEFNLALEMQAKGLKTTNPRAIYMTGVSRSLEGSGFRVQGSGQESSSLNPEPRTLNPLPILDDSRFAALANTLAPDGNLVLPRDRDFITIWGYWRGLEDGEAIRDSMLWTPIDLAHAAAAGLIPAHRRDELLEIHRQRLAAAGYEDLALRPDHVLLSYVPNGAIKPAHPAQAGADEPEMRQCNFAMVRRIGRSD